MQFLYNPSLDIIKTDWPGNAFDGTEFQYADHAFRPDWRKLWRWQTGSNPQRAEKKADNWRPEVSQDHSYLHSSDDYIVWLGHASFLIQLGGVRLITDPVLFDLPFIPRKVQLPYPIPQIRDLDYILVSHDHRDHCDKKSIKTLLQNNRPKKLLTSLKLSTIIGSWAGDTPIEEAGWYQRYKMPPTEPEIFFLPARHWCRRGLLDFNRRLAGSFLIRYQGKTIYFGADSGIGTHFREIGQLFPSIDLALLGIGAYSPDYMMQEIHTNPEEAKQAFEMLGAKQLIPMHYGTYDLSDEPISEPYHRVGALFSDNGQEEKLVRLGVGDVFYL
ncbi:MAG: membrane protein [Saprospiraceae bacterium]|nr:MAG: membrane protein [Saprospiraceae bacterium]